MRSWWSAPRPNPELYSSPDCFRNSLEVIRRANCEVLPLGQAVDRLYHGNLPSRAVALTFDDGNLDFAIRVVPELAEIGYPATVFVSTYYSDFQRPVFNTALGYLLWKHLPGPRIPLRTHQSSQVRICHRFKP